MNRLKFLDGFRGLAILLVILYHAYSRWSPVVPYSDEFSMFPVFSNGYLGVNLFFLISGFVILMSLEKSKDFFDFLRKRWHRLFPAMAISTILIFFTVQFLLERPAGIPKSSSVIPGLIFIDPSWIKSTFNFDTGVLENSFWSLYVEVKYYFIFGILFFSLGRNKAVAGIFVCYFLWLIFRTFQYADIDTFNSLTSAFETLSFNRFGWFASGSLAYLYFISKNKKYIIYSFIAGVLSILAFGLTSKETLLAALFILLIFLSTVYFENLKRLFANRFLIFFGFISYPLYLIHENAMIALIVKLNKYFPGIPGILLPVIPISFLVVVSYYIAREIEPMVQNVIKKIPSLRPV
ncbi:MAG TPA: acyltransferase [Chitinophagaceae bacterium]|nr:acyltransferase [Chitinophagaceae bacterium]